jgi:O-acetyl-ADP-ribose deacetylase (regulator of RNase III)
VKLEVREADIATVEADAIANAANNALWMGVGVAGALKAAGGGVIEREAMAQGPVEVGTAIATTAGNLRARYVIHGAVMGQDLRTDADLVRRTSPSCLALADELGCASLALPAFGTGVGGFALEECARVMVDEARSFEPQRLESVIFAVFGAEAYDAFSSALSSPAPDGS